jgi:hypothetical protein
MNNKPVVDPDKKRRKALMAFQILIYGYLLVMFLIQMYMYHVRDW